MMNFAVPVSSKEPAYLVSVARTGAGVRMALSAAILRALPMVRGARKWDLCGLETATACVETLAMAAQTGSGHTAFHGEKKS